MEYPHETLTDMLQFTDLMYDFHDIPYIAYNSYLLIDNNRKIAIEDILYMNRIWEEACSCTSQLPYIEIKAKNLVFIPNNIDNYYFETSFLQCHPYTATGKTHKYPVTIIFNVKKKNESIKGQIYYLSNGDIGKVELTLITDHYSFNNPTFYTVHAIEKNKLFAVNRILKECNFLRTVLYKS